jgi:hypothetical protein
VFDAWEDDDSHPLIDAAHAMYAQSEPILKERVAAVASAAAVAAASDPNGVNEWRERTEAAEQKATTAEQQLQARAIPCLPYRAAPTRRTSHTGPLTLPTRCRAPLPLLAPMQRWAKPLHATHAPGIDEHAYVSARPPSAAR